MVMVNGRRADLEMRTQWSRNLRAGKDLDYENQLSMLNALNIVCVRRYEKKIKAESESLVDG